MYEIYVETHFSAAHHLREYDGNCAKPHGHNWVVEVRILCKKLNSIGIGIDFRDIKHMVRNILGKLDHSDLNELPEFAEDNPSSENIAAHIYNQINKEICNEDVKVAKVKVSEAPGVGVYYWEDQ